MGSTKVNHGIFYGIYNNRKL